MENRPRTHEKEILDLQRDVSYAARGNFGNDTLSSDRYLRAAAWYSVGGEVTIGSLMMENDVREASRVASRLSAVRPPKAFENYRPYARKS